MKGLKSFGHSQEAWRFAGSNNNKPLGAERVNKNHLDQCRNHSQKINELVGKFVISGRLTPF